MYTFNQLSRTAKKLAVNDYIKGWEETHDQGDLSYDDVYDILIEDAEFLYNKGGEFIGDENEEI
jgi:hypothetical protein